ncbi:phage shock protein PspA [Desulforhopalus singaporensis]|uniref:Phage shock protein A (PspA) family protein n=1 Tax=Desulforhopalus singaporensis TaxID=91360 RepID=A0A1H0LWV0_9BACT|nr:phage shock protein PspA [Desulforhopalus singaporensis]SDO72678.1 phage shock protein A (PspA) family protein [Desulforhopalus singaporensis]
MGIFTRFRDIVSANINSMLDKAEDPEKMIKLMIHEMEDTLIELKSSCAGVIAGRKKLERRFDQLNSKIALWAERAALAVRKGRDDLAREALFEKRKFTEAADGLENEIAEYNGLVQRYQEDIEELENKLTGAKEKKRLLIQRQKRAVGKKRAQEEIRRSNSGDTMARFDRLESRIEQMEAEADLVNMAGKSDPRDEFATLKDDDEIESELAKLKKAQYSNDIDDK